MRRRSSTAREPPPPDSLRCRRSNGKDWRCAEQALPELSYCAYHHHLNYHRPPSDRQSLDGKIADPAVSGAKRPSTQNTPFAEPPQAPPLRRRKKRRRAEACEQPETGFSNLSSNHLQSPVYDALPVRFRPSSLLSTGEEEGLDIYSSVPIPVPVPVSVPVSDELRCRRSNGKEWRCNEQALPGLSYCSYHHNLNYNRSGTKQPKPKSTSPGTSKALTVLERESEEREDEERERNNNGGMCKRTNGKGWQCPNLAVEGLSYCPYHHQLNYRGTSNNNSNNNNSENNNDINLGNAGTSGTKMRDVGIIGLDGLLVKRPRNRKAWFI